MTNKTTNNFKMVHSKRFDDLLTIVLCAPLVLSAWRKLMPGMPAQYEALEFVLVLLLFIYSLLFHQGSRPLHLFSIFAIGCLIACYAFSLLVSFQYGAKFVAVTFIARMVPLLMIFVATKPVNLQHVLHRVVAFYILGAAIMIPFGIYGSNKGFDALPTLMAPTEVFIEKGKTGRAATGGVVQVYFGVFYSNVVASWTCFSFGVLCLFMIEKSLESRKAIPKRYLIGYAMALILCLLFVKRLPTLALLGTGLFTGFRLIGSSKNIRILLLQGGILIFAYIIFSYVGSGEENSDRDNIIDGWIATLSDALVSYPFEIIEMTQGIVKGVLSNSWLPAGLGVAGPEGRYILSSSSAVESGMPLLFKEMGIFFATISTISLVFFIVLYTLLWLSPYRPLLLFVFVIIISFLLKEIDVLCGPYFQIILFWYCVGFLGTQVHPLARAQAHRMKMGLRFGRMSKQNPKPIYPR